MVIAGHRNARHLFTRATPAIISREKANIASQFKTRHRNTSQHIATYRIARHWCARRQSSAGRQKIPAHGQAARESERGMPPSIRRGK